MGRSYPLDLRKRVVAFVDGGRSRRGAAADLQVSPSFSVKLVARHRRTGTLEAQRQGRSAGHRQAGASPRFPARTREGNARHHHARIVAELDARRRRRGRPGRRPRFRARPGLTYKKNPAGRGARTLRRRRSSVTPGSTSASRSCAACRTASPSSTRAFDRHQADPAARQGPEGRAAARCGPVRPLPHTPTFIAALRCHGLTAPGS